jgi:hypothetical protein
MLISTKWSVVGGAKSEKKTCGWSLMPLLYSIFKVLARGVMLFSQVTGFLKDLKDQFSEVAILPIKEFSQLEDMLIREKSEFMVNLPLHLFLINLLWVLW